MLLAALLFSAAGCTVELPVELPLEVCMKKGWGYEVRVEADKAGSNDLKRIVYNLTARGFEVDWYDEVVELRYKGEVNTALYKELSAGDHPFINVMIYYVNAAGGDIVEYPKIDIGNPYRGSASPELKAEIDSYGDLVVAELAASVGRTNVRIERNLMDPPLCL